MEILRGSGRDKAKAGMLGQSWTAKAQAELQEEAVPSRRGISNPPFLLSHSGEKVLAIVMQCGFPYFSIFQRNSAHHSPLAGGSSWLIGNMQCCVFDLFNPGCLTVCCPC